MLRPSFAAIPPELAGLARWLVWRGKKVPYCASAPAMHASSTDPDTWSTLEMAQTTFEEGGFDGVGFALNGDGIVGVDLDKCVTDSTPAPEAMQILDRLGCAYIEYSPSGNGLRAFGYGPSIKGVRGKLNGINVELYSGGRYLTVTGHCLKGGAIQPLTGFAEIASEIRAIPTEKYRDDSSHISVLSVLSVGDAIARTIPSSEGSRNHRLFEFARWVKAKTPNATPDELRSIVRQWHEAALPFISSKEFTTSWYDFRRGFDSVRHPAGTTIKEIIGDLDMESELPAGITGLGYGERGLHLVRICRRLQEQAGNTPFFISSRQAGELLGIHYTDAAKMLWALKSDGVLELVSQGVGNKASRYRFIWSGDDGTVNPVQ